MTSAIATLFNDTVGYLSDTIDTVQQQVRGMTGRYTLALASYGAPALTTAGAVGVMSTLQACTSPGTGDEKIDPAASTVHVINNAFIKSSSDFVINFNAVKDPNQAKGVNFALNVLKTTASTTIPNVDFNGNIELRQPNPAKYYADINFKLVPGTYVVQEPQNGENGKFVITSSQPFAVVIGVDSKNGLATTVKNGQTTIHDAISYTAPIGTVFSSNFGENEKAGTGLTFADALANCQDPSLMAPRDRAFEFNKATIENLPIVARGSSNLTLDGR